MKKIALTALSYFLMCATPHLEAEVPNQDFLNGMDFLQQQQYDKALDAFNLALKAFPKDPFVWERRGYVYYCLGDYYKAIDNYTMSILLAPLQTVFLLQRSLAYHATGNINAMKHDCITAARLGNPVAQDFLNTNNIPWQ